MVGRFHRREATVTSLLDASNTNPVCAHCDFRTVALDETKVACRRCGEVTVVMARLIRMLASKLGAVVIDEEDGNAHWA